MKKLRGFTLIELIVVIAIIGILSAILGLNMMNYLANSRIKTQNNNSRVIFNASQSIVQEYQFKERKSLAIVNDSSATAGEKSDAKKNLNVNEGDFYFYWDGHSGTTVKADGTATGNTSFNNEFARKINKVFAGSEETVYKIWVHDYIVQSVVSGRTDNDRYKGSYPKKSEDPADGNISDITDMTAYK